MKKAEPNFEASLARLEEIADLLESGKASLEETMTLFAQANELFQFCTEKLKNAEEKLSIIVKKQGVFQLELEEND